MLKMPELWGDDERITAHFQTDGNKQYYVETLQCHISSLRDLLHLWEREVITSNELFSSDLATAEIYPLDNFQSAIYEQVMTAMAMRDRFYDNTHYYAISDEDEEEDVELVNDVQEEHVEIPPFYRDSDDWRKFVLITGGPGSGKSQIMKRTIQKCIEENRNVLFSAPTGLVAARLKNEFRPHIHTDTVHSGNFILT